MQLTAEVLPNGVPYIPGICVICGKPFDEESSGGCLYGHEVCVDAFERECDRRDLEDLMSRLPPGTRLGPC